jgi:hypothetical protein
MNTQIFIKRYDQVSMDEAHVYEHLVVHSFYEYASKKLGIHAAVLGSLSAITYPGVISLNTIFYDKRVSDVFIEYIQNEALNMKLLDRVVLQTACEDNTTPKVSNTLIQSIQILTKAKWLNADDLKKPVLLEKYEKDTKSEKQRDRSARYKSVYVTFYIPLDKLSIEDRMLFHRLSVFIHDVIYEYISGQGWYVPDYDIVREYDGRISRSLSVLLPQSAMKTVDIEKNIQTVINQFDVPTNLSYIKSHLKEYAQQKLWKSEAGGRIRTSDIIFSNAQIPELATVERIEKIMKLIEVRVEIIARSVAENL